MILAIDFDGTIVSGKFPAMDALVWGSKEYITRLKTDGHYIIINTCRSGQQAIDAVNFLKENDIPFDRFNDNEPTQVAKYGNNSRKIYAHVYIDDKQIGGLPDWDYIYAYISDLEAKYKASLQN